MTRYKLKCEYFGHDMKAWHIYDTESPLPAMKGNQCGQLYKNPYGAGYSLELHDKHIPINDRNYASLADIRAYLKTL